MYSYSVGNRIAGSIKDWNGICNTHWMIFVCIATQWEIGLLGQSRTGMGFVILTGRYLYV